MERDIALLGYKNSSNAGDAIQTFAMSQFLGVRPSTLVDRERMCDFSDGQPLLLVNGWLAHNPEAIVTQSNIRLKMISVHLTAGMASYLRHSEDLRRVFIEAEPIGARDLYTVEVLQGFGIEAYFSGCVTLTLKRPNVEASNLVILNDLEPVLQDHFSNLFSQDVEITTNYSPLDFDTFERVEDVANPLLAKIASCKLVITSRLHTALPAISMGVPTIFCPPNLGDARFYGLLDFVANALTLQEALSLNLSDLEEIMRDEKLDLGSYIDAFRENVGDLLEGGKPKTHQSRRIGRSFSPVELIDRIASQHELMSELMPIRKSLAKERDALVTERDALVTERDALVTERDALVTERDALVTERDALVTERDALLASNSWKLTKPLRSIFRVVGQKSSDW
jgi:hypothetical protein